MLTNRPLPLRLENPIIFRGKGRVAGERRIGEKSLSGSRAIDGQEQGGRPLRAPRTEGSPEVSPNFWIFTALGLVV